MPMLTHSAACAHVSDAPRWHRTMEARHTEPSEDWAKQDAVQKLMKLMLDYPEADHSEAVQGLLSGSLMLGHAVGLFRALKHLKKKQWCGVEVRGQQHGPRLPRVVVPLHGRRELEALSSQRSRRQVLAHHYLARGGGLRCSSEDAADSEEASSYCWRIRDPV